MVRRLDTSRDYGQVFPRLGRTAYEQDHLSFDVDGYCIEDGPPPDPQEIATETHNGPASHGAVSLCEPEIEESKSTAGDLIDVTQPRPLVEWQTLDWPKFRKSLKATYGVWPASRSAANAILAQHNLITGV